MSPFGNNHKRATASGSFTGSRKRLSVTNRRVAGSQRSRSLVGHGMTKTCPSASKTLCEPCPSPSFSVKRSTCAARIPVAGTVTRNTPPPASPAQSVPSASSTNVHTLLLVGTRPSSIHCPFSQRREDTLVCRPAKTRFGVVRDCSSERALGIRLSSRGSAGVTVLPSIFITPKLAAASNWGGAFPAGSWKGSKAKACAALEESGCSADRPVSGFVSRW